MNKKKRKNCSSTITKKNGKRNGKQRYKCIACNKFFTGGEEINSKIIWKEYCSGKQTKSKKLLLGYFCFLQLTNIQTSTIIKNLI